MNFRKLLSEIIANISGFLGSGQCPPAQKAAMEGVKADFERALNSLGDGTDDKANATAAAAIVGAAGSIVTTMNSLLSGIAQGIQAGIDARIAAGDLVTKEKHTQLCGEAVEGARQAGIAAGKTEAKSQFDAQLATERKAMERAATIARNGLPPATDEVLRLPDADFDVRLAEAGKRTKLATDAGVNPALSLVARCAWAPDGEATLKEVLGLKKGDSAINPLGGGGGGGSGDGTSKGKVAFSF